MRSTPPSARGRHCTSGSRPTARSGAAEAIEILRELGTPLLIHQPSYSMFNRWVEDGLLDLLGEEGIGCIAFSPLAQGLLTDKYLNGIPEDSRVRRSDSFDEGIVNAQNVERAQGLAAIAADRGQTLAQLALAWVLRDPRVTSALIGASSVAQLEQNVAALGRLDFEPDELEQIDRYAVDGSLNIWATSSSG